MSDDPRIRIALTQALIEQTRALADDARARVLGSVAPEELEYIERTGRLTWYPLHKHVAILDQVESAVGQPAFRPFHRALTARYLEQPFLRTVVDTAIRLFGLSPLSVAGALPTGWALAFRGAGEVKYERGQSPHDGLVRLSGMPSVVASSGTMIEGLAGTIEQCFVVTRSTGTVEILERDCPAGRAVYQIRHQAR